MPPLLHGTGVSTGMRPAVVQREAAPLPHDDWLVRTCLIVPMRKAASQRDRCPLPHAAPAGEGRGAARAGGWATMAALDWNVAQARTAGTTVASRAGHARSGDRVLAR